MSISIRLEPAVEKLAVAIGLVRETSGGSVTLDENFFRAPWNRLSTIFSDESQRAALVAAFEALVPQEELMLADFASPLSGDSQAGRVMPSSVVRTTYPLVEHSANGQIYLVISRQGQSPGSAMQLSILGEAQADGNGPGVLAELVLLTAQGSAITPVAGTADFPLTVTATAPVSADGARVSATAKIVAPPNADQSRFSIRLDMGDGNPIEFDLASAGPPVAELAILLLDLAFAQISPLPAGAERLANALPELCGLADEIPQFPASRLLSDPSALRGWLAALATSELSDGRMAMAVFIEALATLTGSAFDVSGGGVGSPAAPWRLELLQQSTSQPRVCLTFALGGDQADSLICLQVGLELEYAGDASVDAALRADAALLSIPLSPGPPVRFLDRFDVRIDATASGNPLVPLSGSGTGSFAVGGLKSGLRCLIESGQPSIAPILELRDVTIGIGSNVSQFERIDFTQLASLSSAAEGVVEDALEAGLGAGGAMMVDATRTLVGLGTSPGLDIASFASNPTAAIAAYYRALIARPDGWKPVLSALADLLGNSRSDVEGSGSPEDPWCVLLDFLATPAESPVRLELVIWNGGSSATPVFTLALRAAVEQPGGEVFLVLRLLEISLPPSGAGQASWMPGITLDAQAFPKLAQPELNGVGIAASAVALAAQWSPGVPVEAQLELRDIVVSTDDETVALGTFSLLDLLNIDSSQPDLGLGLNGDALWPALRILLARSAQSLLGAGGAALLAAIGVSTPRSPALARQLPSLGPLDGENLIDLLGDPAAALRGWLLALCAESATEILETSSSSVEILLRLVRGILTGQLLDFDSLPVEGGGSRNDPWRFPLFSVDAPAALTAWLDNDGPPVALAAVTLGQLADAEIEGAALLDCADRLRGQASWLAGALANRDKAEAASALDQLARLLVHSDGVLPVSAAMPLGSGWQIGEIGSCAHQDACGHPSVTGQVALQVAAMVEGLSDDDWTVLLVAPRFAGADCWGALLAELGASSHTSLTMRVPGISPWLVDLGIIPSDNYYVLDLANDGDRPLADSLATLERAVTALRQVRPDSKMLLVSHSYLGLTVEAFISANQDTSLGAIAIAAPLGFAPPLAIQNPEIADTVRLALALAPMSLSRADNVTGRMLEFIGKFLDGYPLGNEGRAIVSFAGAVCWQRTDLPPPIGSVPAIAIPVAAPDPLIPALASALAEDVSAQSPAFPTRLCWGAQCDLDMDAGTEDAFQARAVLSLQLGDIELATGNAIETGKGQIDVHLELWRDGGWLVHGPALDGSTIGRIRHATLSASVTPLDSAARTRLSVALHGACLRGDDATGAIGLNDPRTAELLDMLIIELDQLGQQEAAVSAALELLDNLGFVRRRRAEEPAAFLADALLTAQADGNSWFAERLPPLLDRPEGLLGIAADAFTPPDGGPWRLVYDGLPLEVRIDKAPWRVSLGLTATGARLADFADLAGLASVACADCATNREGVLTIAGMELTRESDGRLLLSGGWLREPLTLQPEDPEATLEALAELAPLFLGDALLRALVEQALGGNYIKSPIWSAFEDPGGWLADVLSADGTAHLDASVLGALLQGVAGLVHLEGDDDHALVLPGICGLSVEQGQGNPPGCDIHLETLSPVTLWQEDGNDATIAFDLGLSIDAELNGQPIGSISLYVPLPSASGWGGVTIQLGTGTGGPSLTVSTDSGVSLTLLPQLSGFDTLASAGVAALLPYVLDRLETELASRPVTVQATAVAAALDLYDGAQPLGQRFTAKSDQFLALAEALGDGDFAALAPTFASALAQLLSSAIGANLNIAANGGEITAELTDVVDIRLKADLSVDPPALHLSVTNFTLDPVTFDLDIGVEADELQLSSVMMLDIDVLEGVTLNPTLSTSFTAAFADPAGATAQVHFHPLGISGFGVELAPNPAPPTEAQIIELATGSLVPLTGNILLSLADPLLDNRMWNGGRTIGELLAATGLVIQTSPSQPYIVTSSLPTPTELLRGGLQFLTGLAMPLPGDLELSVISDNQLFGLGLAGHPRFEMGDFALTLHLGLPEEHDLGWQSLGEGVGSLLLDLTDASNPEFAPLLRLGGLGVSFGKKEASNPLVKLGGFQLGGAGGYIALDLPLAGPNGLQVQGDVLGAVEVSGLGLTITVPGDGGNAVAASLVKSDGGGDSAPGVPPFDMLIGKTPQGFGVSFSGQPQITVEINRTFGPLHIDSVSLLYNPVTNSPGELGMALDASISLAGISVAADDLSLFVPLDRPAEISDWRIDLAGLAMMYASPTLTIGGGLLKALLPDSSIEYRGLLVVDVAGYGLSAIGAYAEPADAQGSYTSLFGFLAISAPIGGPPYLFVTGLAGGAGYNRRLLTPRDPVSVPGFPLVGAMDDPGSGDPMELLERIGTDIPPARGALWIAAGVRFSTFELLRTTALVTVAVDRGFEITLMGLMRLQLPPVEGAAIVSLELALAAKYSTIDQILSIQAELTDNSWLLSKDCRLTGGFAFVVWFYKPEVILSVGGYSKLFTRPSYYPMVPRVGFDWSVGGGVSIKGGSFFAVTHSAVMVGGSLEASYRVGPVRAWFIAELDVIVTWDPFHYEAAARVEVGVEVKLRACLFGKCVEAPPFKATISATLYLEGPPLNGLVEVDVAVASIRIPFGRKQAQPFLTWQQVRDKYIGVGSTSSVAAGGLAAAEPPDGTEARPWPVASEFSMRIESKMPATGLRINGASESVSGTPLHIDLVPCGPAHGHVSNLLEVTIARWSANGNWQDLSSVEINRLDLNTTIGRFPAAVWDGAASSTDAKGNQVVDTSHPMLSALASLELASTPDVVEATGQLPELAFSGMVDEQEDRSFSFGQGAPSAAGPPTESGGLVGVDSTAGPATTTLPMERIRRTDFDPAEPVRPVLQPRLTASFQPMGAALSPTVVTEAAISAVNRTQIWSLSPNAAHSFKVSKAGQRVVALSATGAVLADDELETGGTRLPEGVQSLIVSEPAEGGRLGWDLATELVQAGPATFIAPGAVLTINTPWSPRKSVRFGGRPRQSFAAVKLLKSLNEVTTRLSWKAGAAPESLLIRLDRLNDAADPDTVQVDISGNVAHTRSQAIKGDRIELVYPLRVPAEMLVLSVAVSGAEDWTISAIIALDEEPSAISDRLVANEFVRLSPKLRRTVKTPEIKLEIMS